MIKAHQIKLYPSRRQKALLHKSFGIARYSYNWALSKWNEMYENGEKPSAYALIKLQNQIKREQMPFFLEVSKTAPQYAIHNLERAFMNFFKGNAKYPKFKKKGIRDSFVAVENKETFKQKNKLIRLPRIGWVKCSENLRYEGKVNNVTVKRVADMYFAVINVDIRESISILKPKTGESQSIVGVDLGIKSMLVLSDGLVFENPHALKNNLRQLKRLQRSLNRKVKGSSNQIKAKMRVARKHYRISCIRNNAIHQATSYIVSNYNKIIIEDLNVQGMIRNHRLAQSICDVSFGEVKRQLIYKAHWEGKELIVADRYYASSKTCSNCGHRKEKLRLSERTFNCEACGFVLDRDYNAAINLANYSPTEKLPESKACGDLSSIGTVLFSESMKQEIIFNNQKL